MKKNSFLIRIASGLLMLCLITSCSISSTLAKYVATGGGTDTARVAKFGVTIVANGDTFSQTYAADDKTFTLATNSVVSTDKVVAPGTSGTMASVSLTGTPEVAVRVTYTGKFDISDDWTVNGNFYCPIEVTVGADTIKGTAYTTKAEFVAAVNEKINGVTAAEYAAGTNLATATAAGTGITVTWSWPFNGNDTSDTELGNTAATGTASTVTLGLDTTVTQID
jgi:hypothetical protein